MSVLGKMALATVAGGVALGAMLGAAANPVMKKAPEQPWMDALQAPVAADPDYLVLEAPPEDLSPYRDSYAPTWAREELTDWEPVYPEWAYSDFADDEFAELSAADEPHIEAQPVLTPAQVSPSAEPAPPEPAGVALAPRRVANLGPIY